MCPLSAAWVSAKNSGSAAASAIDHYRLALAELAKTGHDRPQVVLVVCPRVFRVGQDRLQRFGQWPEIGGNPGEFRASRRRGRLL